LRFRAPLQWEKLWEYYGMVFYLDLFLYAESCKTRWRFEPYLFNVYMVGLGALLPNQGSWLRMRQIFTTISGVIDDLVLLSISSLQRWKKLLNYASENIICNFNASKTVCMPRL
jgi:hypothetical protein